MQGYHLEGPWKLTKLETEKWYQATSLWNGPRVKNCAREHTFHTGDGTFDFSRTFCASSLEKFFSDVPRKLWKTSEEPCLTNCRTENVRYTDGATARDANGTKVVIFLISLLLRRMVLCVGVIYCEHVGDR